MIGRVFLTGKVGAHAGKVRRCARKEGRVAREEGMCRVRWRRTQVTPGWWERTETHGRCRQVTRLHARK
jgi:hypothetical protein